MSSSSTYSWSLASQPGRMRTLRMDGHRHVDANKGSNRRRNIREIMREIWLGSVQQVGSGVSGSGPSRARTATRIRRMATSTQATCAHTRVFSWIYSDYKERKRKNKTKELAKPPSAGCMAGCACDVKPTDRDSRCRSDWGVNPKSGGVD